MNTDTVGLTIIMKHLFRALVPSDPERARMLDAVKAEIVEKIGVERCEAFGVLWE